MIPARHPSPPLVARYATGEMPMAPALVVAAHLERCAPCAGQVAAIEASEGRLLAALPDAPLAPDALARALDRLEAPRPGLPARGGDAAVGGVTLPRAVAAAGLHRRRWLAPGFWAARVRAPPTAGWRLVLLRAPQGAPLPWHRHLGDEMLMVVAGAFADGEDCAEGDFVHYAPDGGHRPKVTEDGPCACLIASQGGAQWSGLGGLAAAWLGL